MLVNYDIPWISTDDIGDEGKAFTDDYWGRPVTRNLMGPEI